MRDPPGRDEAAADEPSSAAWIGRSTVERAADTHDGESAASQALIHDGDGRYRHLADPNEQAFSQHPRHDGDGRYRQLADGLPRRSANADESRSRSRRRVAARALIAAIQGSLTETSAVAHDTGEAAASQPLRRGCRGLSRRLGSAVEPTGAHLRDRAVIERGHLAQATYEWRADCYSKLLQAARAPIMADVTVARTQLGARPSSIGAGGPQAAGPMLTHTLLATGPVTWCRVCGAYADARVRGLRGRCAGPPAGRGGSGRTSLRRLLAGRHPLSGEHIDATARSLR